MTRILLMPLMVLAALSMGGQTASADSACAHGACAGPHPKAAPVPAPLLAAGIPAFAALGGGVVVSRLFRRRKDQA